jgi:uncharacterized damage-inducible protein DinB
MIETALAKVVGDELGHELGEAQDRIGHCLGQLSEEQVWSRPTEAMNSVGNLLLHLTGNVRQWLVSGLGGTSDDRDRPAEFAERRHLAKADLWDRLKATVDAARAVLAARTAEEWLRPRRIQGFEVTGVGAAVSSVAHFRGHTQEIVHMTRTLLGDRYRFAWTPATPEQGAPATK